MKTLQTNKQRTKQTTKPNNPTKKQTTSTNCSSLRMLLLVNANTAADRRLVNPPPPYNGVSFVRASCPFLPRAVRPMLPDPGPPQTHLADDPLETSKHCIKEKAARLRGLPFLAYSCSGGAKMTLARGGSKPAVVRGHLASKLHTFAGVRQKNELPVGCEVCFCDFGLLGPQKVHTFAGFRSARRESVDTFAKKASSRPQGTPGGPTNWPRGLTHRALLVYKLSPASDPQSVGHLAVALLASFSTANTDPPILFPSNTDPPILREGGRWVTSRSRLLVAPSGARTDPPIPVTPLPDPPTLRRGSVGQQFSQPFRGSMAVGHLAAALFFQFVGRKH